MPYDVEIFSIEDSGYYHDEFVGGSTVKVTLRSGDCYASCSGILIWDTEEDDKEMLYAYMEEWEECAKAGEEGYKYWEEK